MMRSLAPSQKPANPTPVGRGWYRRATPAEPGHDVRAPLQTESDVSQFPLHRPTLRIRAGRRSRALPPRAPGRAVARRRAPPALVVLLALVTFLAPAAAFAHGTVVLGAVTANPDPPRPGAPLILTVDLAKLSKAPVEGARLEGSLRPAGQPDAAATPLAFQEYPEPYGTYRARLEAAPPAGRYTLTVRDRTYPKEDIRASVTLQVGGAQPNGSLDFTFPPVRGGPRSVVRWLLWLVGLPLLAGVVVTVLVLRAKNEDSEDDGSKDEARERRSKDDGSKDEEKGRTRAAEGRRPPPGTP